MDPMRARHGRRRRRAPKRRGLFVGFLVPVLLLISLGTYFQLDKKVTLILDGHSRQVHTFAGSVEELLLQQDVALGVHDAVSHSLGSGLDDGMQIEILTAKEITLVLNGRARTLFVTGTTVEDVLEQINLRRERGAFVSRSRDARIRDGDVIELREAVQVHLRVGGEAERRIITNAPSVGYLLDSLGVVLRSHDRVTPRLRALPTDGALITVTQVRFKKVVERSFIPFRSIRRYSDDLPRGITKVDRQGADGVHQARFLVRYENGQEVGRKLLEEHVVRGAVSELVTVGTRDPHIQEGVASWYERNGLVAAHKTLPKGTLVKVTNLENGKSVVVTIDDRGPYVDGRIIDLSDDAFARLAPLSKGTVSVQISW